MIQATNRGYFVRRLFKSTDYNNMIRITISAIDEMLKNSITFCGLEPKKNQHTGIESILLTGTILNRTWFNQLKMVNIKIYLNPFLEHLKLNGSSFSNTLVTIFFYVSITFTHLINFFLDKIQQTKKKDSWTAGIHQYVQEKSIITCGANDVRHFFLEFKLNLFSIFFFSHHYYRRRHCRCYKLICKISRLLHECSQF